MFSLQSINQTFFHPWEVSKLSFFSPFTLFTRAGDTQGFPHDLPETLTQARSPNSPVPTFALPFSIPCQTTPLSLPVSLALPHPLSCLHASPVALFGLQLSGNLIVHEEFYFFLLRQGKV